MQPPRFTWFWCVLILLWVPCCSAQQTQAIDWNRVDPADHAYERWYLITIDDQPVGYLHEWMRISGDKIRSGYEELKHESHGGEKSVNQLFAEWTETKDFKPIQIVTRSKSADQAVTETYRFTEEGIDWTSSQEERRIKRMLPTIKSPFLTSAQRNIAVDLHRQRATKTFSFNALDPLIAMAPYRTTYQRKAAADQKIDSKNTRAWSVAYSLLPGFEMIEWSDTQHRTVQSSFNLGGVQQLARLSDEDVVDTKFVAVELASRSIVVPDRPIENIRKVRQAVYELTGDGINKQSLPINTAHQQVELTEPGRVRVKIDLNKNLKPVTALNDTARQAYLETSIFIDHQDSEVQKLADLAVRAIDKSASNLDIANACKRAVSAHLTEPSLAVGSATASEVVRTHRGDCTESAVLLAALLRANKIPSRCVTGLVYSADEFAGQSNVFVYHMWVQAWIEDSRGVGRWVDFDAAMWRYTAGHIALGASAMGQNAQADQVGLIPMQEGLGIKVVQLHRVD